MKNSPAKENIFRLLPAVDALLQTATARRLLPHAGAGRLTGLARAAAAGLRVELGRKMAAKTLNPSALSRHELLRQAEDRMEKLWQSEQSKRLRKVINATGVIIHTNLGRAPLAAAARQALVEEAAGYCSLEYDLETGKRGERGGRAAGLLAEATGAEDALIVNNCAAAAILVLTALGRGGEAVVSRGELVEIGGDFRIPDVMEQSGAILREVGTTNRTKISDYERAITERTRLLVKVHPSNYRIVGFTAVPEVAELARLARQHDILFYEDAGSGALFDLGRFGLQDEPVIPESVSAGADVITFSGDKLLGGAQAGLIVGRREVIERLRRHPLYRALRAGKLIYAALEATLEAFRRETALEEIPVLQMLSASSGQIKKRTERIAARIGEKLPADSGLRFEIAAERSAVGGGSAPAVQPETYVLSVRHREKSVNELEEVLRRAKPVPVAARILDDRLLIDLRTVAPDEEDRLVEILAAA